MLYYCWTALFHVDKCNSTRTHFKNRHLIIKIINHKIWNVSILSYKNHYELFFDPKLNMINKTPSTCSLFAFLLPVHPQPPFYPQSLALEKERRDGAMYRNAHWCTENTCFTNHWLKNKRLIKLYQRSWHKSILYLWQMYLFFHLPIKVTNSTRSNSDSNLVSIFSISSNLNLSFPVFSWHSTNPYYYSA